jgi:hypothetical protein
MKKSELKQMLKPLIKECIKEVIFEEGVLSGLITEVAQGLGNIQPQVVASTPKLSSQKSERTMEAKKSLNEMKSQLQKAAGLQGIFENTKPMSSAGRGETGKYGALRDKDPSDAGVNIDGLMKLTGGWSHLT